MKKFVCFIIILIFIQCQPKQILNAKPTSPRDMQLVIKQLVLQLTESGNQRRARRLAVLNFSSTRQQVNKENVFGNYFSEALISEFMTYNKYFKLFERKRLDAIMQENALSLSGLINEKQALKLGEMAPIDIILSGTYTKLKNYIEINSRLIDVVSGEILNTYNGKIILTEDLASLFEQPQQEAATAGAEKIDPCKEPHNLIINGLGDLSSPQKVNEVVDLAINIQFDMKCGVIHFKVIGYFKRYKVYSEAYKKFLLTSLKEIQLPSGDNRAGAILGYFAMDGEIDEEEWNAGLKIVRKSGTGNLNSYLQSLLFPARQVNKNETTTIIRVDELLNLVENCKVGLPVAVPFEKVYFRIIDIFTPYNFMESTVSPLVYLYEKYNTKITGKKRDDFYKYYHSIYGKATSKNHKIKILNVMIDYFNSHEINPKLGDQMFDFIRDFQNNQEDDPEKYPVNDYKKYLKSCRKQLSKALAETDIRSQKVDRILFCLENDISCPGLVPTVNDCIADIKSDDSFKRNDAAFYLSKMGKKAKPAEETILTFIKFRQRRYFTGSNEFLGHVINILGNIKTTEAKALNMLVQCLTHKGYGIPEKAIPALEKIGKPALPYLIKSFENLEDYGKIRAIDLMSKLGKDAKSAIAPMKKLYKETYNTWVKDAIEDALEKIE